MRCDTFADASRRSQVEQFEDHNGDTQNARYLTGPHRVEPNSRHRGSRFGGEMESLV